MIAGIGSTKGAGEAAFSPLILCYHAISSSWKCPLALTPELLAAQVKHLLRRGYTPATLSEAMNQAPNRKSFVVTFDDAYLSVFDRAFPVLANLDVRASLFVPTDIVDSQGLMTEMIPIRPDWIGPSSELRAMSWDGVLTLDAAGWEIASHTCSHPEMTKIDEGLLRTELERSKAICEDRLQKPCSSFAYPFGAYDEEVKKAVAAAGYSHAVTLEQHVLQPLRGRGAMDLPREGMYPTTNWPKFMLNTSRTVRRLRLSAGFNALGKFWL